VTSTAVAKVVIAVINRSSPRCDRSRSGTAHYDWLPEVPRPAQPGGPPIWLAGPTRPLERTGRRYDGWLPYPPDPAEYARGLATIRAVAGDRPITPALFATVHLDDDVERGTRALDACCQATYRLPLDVVGKIQVLLTGPDVAAVDADAFAGQLAKVAELVSVLRRRLEGESL
jgi:alkanesulfonate monooxygenase SsuD/methylene tetrahydromethanopterin reductase-like flavin-dependent oxidoreductase (luciferase family)